MACPTCDDTMQNAGPICEEENVVLWWCPRCGTCKKNTGEVYKPWLVKRCVDFGAHLSGTEHGDLIDQYRIVGIEESIGGIQLSDDKRRQVTYATNHKTNPTHISHSSRCLAGIDDADGVRLRR